MSSSIVGLEIQGQKIQGVQTRSEQSSRLERLRKHQENIKKCAKELGLSMSTEKLAVAARKSTDKTIMPSMPPNPMSLSIENNSVSLHPTNNPPSAERFKIINPALSEDDLHLFFNKQQHYHGKQQEIHQREL